MSFQAMTWALNQKTGSPARKAILMSIANYADENGYCWPGRETIAEESEQSVDSVDRHLKALEEMGFIKRTPRPPRADGGEQSKLIRLMFDQAKMTSDLKANRSPADTEVASENEGMSPPPQIAAPPSRKLRSSPPQVAAPPAADCGPNLLLEPIKDSSPLTPQGALGGDSISDLKNSDEAFHRFRSAWPSDPTNNWQNIRTIFDKLKEPDRLAAADTADRYVRYCQNINRKLQAPKNWLRDRGWVGFQEMDQKTIQASERAKERVWVLEDTPEWEAWAKFYRDHGKVPRQATDLRSQPGGRGWYFPSRLPDENTEI
ncbi:helix-turn-helix domain-containing protein [Microvirga puerhi]|uniref:Helix-turn-helix domain-containing protein n=1 Tax=Microvirga puerhi TaxID=2876078 RepID=A0ABS7VTM8_9HYPH|nr:helix-turn-helix domain-containing protein [Microvirga puerhi]MBZ6078926.1 helix-turn-helix domain-containing protein [Microvirga puerhi]